jgi:hypothetical protein
MSVTITITVSPTGEAEVRTGADVVGEAPPPSLGGLEGAAVGATQEAAMRGAEPPAPLELDQLGLGAAAEAGGAAAGPPPEDLSAAAQAADTTVEAPEPTPIEDLE